jgi:uncharacterized peroxidase-related enzyme
MHAPRQDERTSRASEIPIVEGLPNYPGILAAMMISPTLAVPLRALADALLAKPYEGATLSRAERELIATAVSAGNDCFYCMDTHGAFASVLLEGEGVSPKAAQTVIDNLKYKCRDHLPERMKALIAVAMSVRDHGRKLERNDVSRALDAGATHSDVQLAVLIAAAFCMYNRIVDGFRAKTPADVTAHHARARQIAKFGYRDSRLTAIPAVG